jgi:hypothetical protein
MNKLIIIINSNKKFNYGVRKNNYHLNMIKDLYKK